MGKNLYTDVGQFTPDGLIADTSFPLQTGSATIRAGQGLLLRGTLLAFEKDEEGGGSGYVVATNELAGDRILTDDTLVGGADVVAEAYISGSFATSRIICEGDIEVHRETLRTKGIYLKTTVEKGE